MTMASSCSISTSCWHRTRWLLPAEAEQQHKQNKDLKKTFRFHGHNLLDRIFSRKTQLHESRIQAFMTASYLRYALNLLTQVKPRRYFELRNLSTLSVTTAGIFSYLHCMTLAIVYCVAISCQILQNNCIDISTLQVRQNQKGGRLFP